jgi:iron-sulfur cluster repair protein YtfE (RIC family)
MTHAKPSVAEALGGAHAALLYDLRKLEEATQSLERLEELKDHLRRAQKHISEHFRFEEQDGYMELVRKREPRLERAIQELQEEHRQLAQSLEALMAQVERLEQPDPAVCQRISNWIERVRQHEHRENELVQDAFNLDIAGED